MASAPPAGEPLTTSEATAPMTDLQEHVELAAAEAKGAEIHAFDPDAPPGQKAAQTLKAAQAKIGPIDDISVPSLRGKELKAFREDGGSAVATDIGTEPTNIPLTTGAQDAEKETQREVDKEAVSASVPDEERAHQLARDEGRVNEDGTENPPGALPAKEAEKNKPREIPSWFAIGWTSRDRTLFLSPEEAEERSILADFLQDAYYGQWYHNAGIIVFAVLSSHFITLFGGGYGWLILIMAVCATYYETSVKRVRRNARDDLAREVAKKGLKTDVESAAWINSFMQRFWLIYEPVLSATIVASVDQVLQVSTPAFLDSLRMTTFTLGTKPPHIDHVRTFPDTEDDIVIMEWKVSFTPNDLSDLTHKQAARKVNPKIVLEVRFGKGFASVGKDIIVEDMSFSGTMRIKLKLINNFPHVQTVDLSFMQPPSFDFVLKPVGFDLSLIPGLQPFIQSQVHASLGPMMYDPNTFTLDLAQILSGAPADTAVGVLAVTVHNGRGLKGTKLGGGNPDPYVSFNISGRAELARTKTKHNTRTKYILLNSLTETLHMAVMDYNDRRHDSVMGSVTFDLKSLAEDGEQTGLRSDVIFNGQPRGRLNFDVNYYPVLKAKKLPDGTVEPIPETTSGVVRIVVHQAKQLDPRGQQINPFFKLLLNGQSVHRSQTLKRSPNPIWERPHEMLVTAKDSAVIGLQVLDDNTLTWDAHLGSLSVRLTDILEANAKGSDWFPLSNARSGKVRITAEWKPVLMAGAINGAAAYTPPIGVVRLYMKRSRDLKNVEALTGGKSDPYVRVLHRGLVVARTYVHDNNLDPVYLEIHSPKDTFVFEVMDYQHNGRDRSLGIADFSVAELVSAGPDKKNKPWVGTGKITRTDKLKSDGKKTVKGDLDFEAEFFPCLPLQGVSFAPADQVNSAVRSIPESTEVSTAASASVEDVSAGNTTPKTASFVSLPSTPKTNGDSDRPSALTKSKPNGDVEGVTMSREELLKTQTGVLAFQVISGQLAKKGARLEVLFDDGYWPTFSTEHSRSTHNTWDEIGEVLIRELDFSTVTLQLNTADKDTREDVIAKVTVDMNDFLESSLDKPFTFTLMPTDGFGSRSTVTIMAKYIPVEMQLLKRESITNTGSVRVDLLDGKGLPSADRNGKSDPYCVFELNGERVYKSEVCKKTLAPVWNEKFEMHVPSRERAQFLLEVYDWDRVGAADKLGRASIDLDEGIEPFQAVERTVTLSDFKDASKSAGEIRIRMVFTPQFMHRSRQATSTFSAGRIGSTLGGGVYTVGGGVLHAGEFVGRAGVGAVGTVGKAGVGAVGTVGRAGVGAVGTVGKAGFHGVGAVGKGVFGVGRRLTGQRRGSYAPSDAVDFAATDAADPAAAGYALPGEDTEVLMAPTEQGGAEVQELAVVPGAGAPGSLTVTLGQLTNGGDAGDKKAVVVKLNHGKPVLETHSHRVEGDSVSFHETVVVKTPAEGAADLTFNVVHKKAIGSDKVLASATVPIWQHISPSAPAATFPVPLTGSHPGQLVVSLAWIPTPAFMSHSPSVSTLDPDQRSIAGSTTGASPSIKRSRFSSARFSRHKEASPAPAA
ncbi:Tricalbin-2 [Rhodotorula sphaerocarpa]